MVRMLVLVIPIGIIMFGITTTILVCVVVCDDGVFLDFLSLYDYGCIDKTNNYV